MHKLTKKKNQTLKADCERVILTGIPLKLPSLLNFVSSTGGMAFWKIHQPMSQECRANSVPQGMLLHTLYYSYMQHIGSFWTHGRVRLKPDDTWWRTGGEVKGKLANGVGSQYSHTTSERGVSSITNADAHTSAASSLLNWCARWFKWTRPFRRKTKSGFCACAITFQTHSTQAYRTFTFCLVFVPATKMHQKLEKINMKIKR